VYDGQFSLHRKKAFGTKTENEGKQFIVFSQNHDQVGNRMLGERNSQLVNFEMQKLLVAAVMVSPYLPMLFMGEEWSEPNPFLYFVSHTDEELAEAVRKGRKGEFAAFHIQGEAPNPVAEETFLQSKLQWNLTTQGQNKIMLEFYKALIQLRKTNPVLKELNRKNLEVITYKDQNSLLLKRWNDQGQIVCFMNFSKEKQTIVYDQPLGKKVFDSADPRWNGPQSAPDEINDKNILIQPGSVLLYQTHY
jgi:maltooligosyltrehalose trehalohydrolase